MGARALPTVTRAAHLGRVTSLDHPATGRSSHQPVTADSRGPWKLCSFRGSREADGGGWGVRSPAVAPHPASLRGGGCPGKSGWVQSLKRKYS